MAELDKKRNSNVQSDVLKYLTSNADRPLVYNEIATAISAQRTSVASAITRLARAYPNVKTKARGIVTWDSAAKEESSKQEEMMIKVIERKSDGTCLVLDQYNEKLYILKPLEW